VDAGKGGREEGREDCKLVNSAERDMIGVCRG